MNDDPWEVRPSNLEDQVERYVRQAKDVAMNPDLKKKYARILIAAAEIVTHRERDEQAIRDIVVRVAVGEHGIYATDPEKARAKFAAARRGQQQVHASATGCAQKLVRLGHLLRTHHQSLPVDVAARYPLEQLSSAIELVGAFALATKPNTKNIAEVKVAKSELSLTKQGHAFVWWRYYIPQSKGKWADMYELACRWRLSEAKGLDNFQRRVRKLTPAKDRVGRTYILLCPPWALV